MNQENNGTLICCVSAPGLEGSGQPSGGLLVPFKECIVESPTVTMGGRSGLISSIRLP